MVHYTYSYSSDYEILEAYSTKIIQFLKFFLSVLPKSEIKLTHSLDLPADLCILILLIFCVLLRKAAQTILNNKTGIWRNTFYAEWESGILWNWSTTRRQSDLCFVCHYRAGFKLGKGWLTSHVLALDMLRGILYSFSTTSVVFESCNIKFY